MRVLTILHDLSAGGSERVALRLAAEWRHLGLDSRLLLLSSQGRAELPAGVPVARLHREVPRSLTSRFRVGGALRAAVEAEVPDILFLPGNWHFALARGLARARPRPAIVAKLSNPPLPALLPGAGPFAVRALRALLQPVDALAFWPASLAPGLEKLLPGLRLEPVPNPPVSVAVGSGAQRPPAQRRQLLVAGRLVPQKDVKLAVEAFAIAAAGRDLHLTIAGDGPDRAAMEAQVARLGLAEKVRFLGHVTDLNGALAVADLLLVTSRFEGTPAVVFEALAAGVPVVSTPCSPILPALLDRPGRGRIVGQPGASGLASAILAQLEEPEGVGDVAGILAPHAPAAIAARYAGLFADLANRPLSRAAE